MISQTLGEKLKQIREGSGSSIRGTALNLRIKEEFVIALENGEYEKLPGEVYIKNWLKNYAKLFKAHAQELISLYENEKVVSRYSVANCFLSPREETKTPLAHRVRRLAVIIACVGIVGYVGYGIINLTTAPPLEVYEPLDHLVSKSTTVHIKGKTTPNAKVLINNQPVSLSPTGTFDEPIEVSYGLNELIISATSVRGKTRTITRTILVEQKGGTIYE